MRVFAVHGWLFSAAAALAISTLVSAETTPATKPAVKPAAPAAKPLSEAEKAATAEYEALVTAYLKNDFEALETHLKNATAQIGKLNTEQRANVEYVRAASQQQRPKWWEKTKSSENTSFQSSIWGKNVMTNYVPADTLGYQRLVDIQDGKLVVIVVWRPTQVDNPRAADGTLAKKLSVTKGDIGEVVVWHELGHLFITSQISADAAYELYTKYKMLYSHLQEFYADTTALYHSTPHARRISMIARLDLLDPPYDKYEEMEPHTRGSNAIGSMFLAEVLMDPTKWPNVHLPPKVPDGDVELQTIIYMYEHFTSEWTFAEDKAMREWIYKTIKTQGDQIFRSKGMISLPEKNTFSLMEAQDRDFQKKRNTWVAAKLKLAIDSGRADKEPATPATPKETTVTINGRTVKMRNAKEQRIEVPDH